MSLDLLWILCGLQHSGRARTCSVKLSWPWAPCFTPTEGNYFNGTACKEISTARFIFCLFFHLWLYVQGRKLLVSQRTEQWKHGTHLMWVLCASIFWAFRLWLWDEVFFTGRKPGKWKPLPHQPSTKKRKNSPTSTFFSPSLCLNCFILVGLYSLWLILNCSGSNHHHAGLQGVVAAPPGLPEDTLLPLVPLLGRRALEVSSI